MYFFYCNFVLNAENAFVCVYIYFYGEKFVVFPRSTHSSQTKLRATVSNCSVYNRVPFVIFHVQNS